MPPHRFTVSDSHLILKVGDAPNMSKLRKNFLIMNLSDQYNDNIFYDLSVSVTIYDEYSQFSLKLEIRNIKWISNCFCLNLLYLNELVFVSLNYMDDYQQASLNSSLVFTCTTLFLISLNRFKIFNGICFCNFSCYS